MQETNVLELQPEPKCKFRVVWIDERVNLFFRLMEVFVWRYYRFIKINAYWNRLGTDPTGTYGHTTYSSSNGGPASHVDAPSSSPGIPANATLVSRTKQQLTTQQVCIYSFETSNVLTVSNFYFIDMGQTKYQNVKTDNVDERSTRNIWVAVCIPLKVFQFPVQQFFFFTCPHTEGRGFGIEKLYNQ